eukprot:228428-Chlamydomonas_euryale.AAC.1
MSDTGRALSRRVAASALSRRAAKACSACAGTRTGPVIGSVWGARVSWAGGKGVSNGGGAAAAEAPRMS